MRTQCDMEAEVRGRLRLLLLLTTLHSWVPVSDGKHVFVHLGEEECSPGTVPVVKDNATVACGCGNVPSVSHREQMAGIAYCVWNTTNTNTLYAVVRDTYWAGYVQNPEDDDNFIVTPCPFGYCNISGGTLLPNPLDSDSVICGPRNRMGLLCAVCKDGYAVAFNRLAFDCIKCSGEEAGSSVAIWIFADIVPELILVVVYLLVDAPLLKGQMNSFLLFAQTFYAMNLYANGALDFSMHDKNGHSGLSDWVYWLYSLWSLNFITAAPGFPPLCIHSRMNALSQLSFQYVYTILPFSVILGAFFLQWCYKREPLRCGHIFRVMQRGHNCIARIQHSLGKSSSSIRNGLASFLLLAYSKLLFVSFYILAYVDLRQEGHSTRRVFLDATKEPFDGEHQKYAAPALCVIILFSVLPALLLLCYTPILKLTARMKCCYKAQLRESLHESLATDQELQLTACGKFMQSLIMFLRTFNECFQEKFAFFAGVLFLYRIIIWAIFANTPNLADQYVAQIAVTFLLLVLHLVCKPYRRHLSWINVWDAVMYVNIIVINAFSLYHYQAWTANLKPNLIVYSLQQTLVLLPLLYLTILFIVYTVNVILRWRRRPNYTEFPRRGSARLPRSMYGSTEIHSESAPGSAAVGEDGGEDPATWLRESLVAQDSLKEGERLGWHSLCYQLCPSVCRGAGESNGAAQQGRSSRSAVSRDCGMTHSLSVDAPTGQMQGARLPKEVEWNRELTPQVITVSV